MEVENMKEKYKKYLDIEHHFDQKTMLGILGLMFIITGIYGFLVEYIFYYINSGMKQFYWRGGHFLPWVNIYAYASIIIYCTMYKNRKKPLKIFLLSMILCGVLELITGWTMDKVRAGNRCWDYNKEIWNFGNIGGYVCLRSILFFGISSLGFIYILVPICFFIASKINKKLFLGITLIVCIILFIDEIYNCLIARIFHWPRAYNIYSKMGVHYMSFK